MKIPHKTYLLIEGTDLAGKTTAATNFIANRSDAWDLRHNSLLNAPNSLSDIADQMVESGEYGKTTINLAYAASILVDIDMFAWPRENTVQESVNIVRSIGHAHVNNDRDVENILMNALERYPEFDSAFYLTADLESRLARLAVRTNQSVNDMLVVKDPKKFFAIDDVAKSIAVERFGAKLIDTSKLSQDDVQYILSQEVFGPNS